MKFSPEIRQKSGFTSIPKLNLTHFMWTFGRHMYFVISSRYISSWALSVRVWVCIRI